MNTIMDFDTAKRGDVYQENNLFVCEVTLTNAIVDTTAFDGYTWHPSKMSAIELVVKLETHGVAEPMKFSVNGEPVKISNAWTSVYQANGFNTKHRPFMEAMNETFNTCRGKFFAENPTETWRVWSRHFETIKYG